MLGSIKGLLYIAYHSPYSRWTFLSYIYAKINFASSLLSLLVILEIYPIYINNFIGGVLSKPHINKILKDKHP